LGKLKKNIRVESGFGIWKKSYLIGGNSRIVDGVLFMDFTREFVD
jgi:hypothetical protein